MLLGVWWSRDGRQRGRLLRRGASLSGGSFGTVGAGWTGGAAEQPICSGGCVLVRRKDSVLTHRVDRVALVRRSDSDGAVARVELLREHCWLRPAWPSCTGRVASRSVRVTARRALTSEKNPILRRRVLVRA